ncbi:histidine kinase dimerization/phosphoacceptor domain -containing protein [Methanoregula sp.]|uniref:histidine kinase dimerization/phosphoacceptor domain -containing protein n=1 Tax=Methanoregula sp. TaxID=2052170 RepID=UPI002C60A63C|nr:histidine kinase dimerization/phosphoacceptor domain -containing protein [Methanoregula sp.]HVP97019.1 histidine kinase dimerization/phosphoacceptor domain -containing protein [Methanoregula sp.]
MGLLIITITGAIIVIAVISLVYGIGDLYEFLFLLPIVMTAYFFPRYGIATSAVMGIILIVLNLIFLGSGMQVLSLSSFTFAVFVGIGGIVTMLSENISGLKKRYQDIFSMSEAGMIIFDRETGMISEANPSFLTPLGYLSLRSGVPPFSELFDRPEQYRDLVRDVSAEGRVTDRKCQIRTASGDMRQFQVSACFFFGQYILCTFTDITERKKYEDTLRQSLAEKEILLKEVHHRVKNNMQVIMSLLELNALKAENERERAQYAEMQGRVMTMALIHEKLYQSPVAGSINAQDYFADLLQNIISASAMPGVQCIVKASGVHLDIDKAIPCGLIINELTTNSLKYAFRNTAGSEIQLLLGTGGNGVCTMVYFDNGPGIPPSHEISGSGTLGIRLIHMLVRQLRGEILMTNHNGTHVRIQFPLAMHDYGMQSTVSCMAEEQTTISRWS